MFWRGVVGYLPVNIIQGLVGLATIVIMPIIINFMTFGPLRSWLITALPWAAMFGIVMLDILRNLLVTQILQRNVLELRSL